MATWDEAKRCANIGRHGLDFVDVDSIWDNFTITREDVRQSYGEARYVTFGRLRDEVIVAVYTYRDADIHVISLRRAEKYEARYYIETAAAFAS